MSTALKTSYHNDAAPVTASTAPPAHDHQRIKTLVSHSWSHIAPAWPLKNLIAVNPLAGFEDLSFEDALRLGQVYFQQRELPLEMQEVNRLTIKWLQIFFDQGQATLTMPGRETGLYAAVLRLLPFDRKLPAAARERRFPSTPHQAIAECLLSLGIPAAQQGAFLTLMLTTLPGWAAYVKYRNNWADAPDAAHPHPATPADYLALRLVIICLVWHDARQLLAWHDAALQISDIDQPVVAIGTAEKTYQTELLGRLGSLTNAATAPDAQLVFCIDVRSEPFRRALEAQGAYETLGFAGFFGLPISVQNAVTGTTYASCPVLLQPAHQAVEQPRNQEIALRRQQRYTRVKQIYQSLKYSFTTPFTLVEALGPFAGLWMAARNFYPLGVAHWRNHGQAHHVCHMQSDAIPVAQKTVYAASALKTMGLTKNFAPLVILCGHRAETQNNAYATALDCGACGGHGGAPNAKLLADILNDETVRINLAHQGLDIPDATWFMAAEHNTTTDALVLYDTAAPWQHHKALRNLKQDLAQAQQHNNRRRARQLGYTGDDRQLAAYIARRAQDWAQVRPEWGLVRNAAFIVGPRSLTQNIDLDGRCFLHSYDWVADEDGGALAGILTAPMVVAQWINAQYLFSTLDNVAYGGGSKISKNIAGKIGIMQGNASDLMPGLPLQSVFADDRAPYHRPQRLLTVVTAPRARLDAVITQHDILKKLFGNGWVALACLEPTTGEKFILQRNFLWQKAG